MTLSIDANRRPDPLFQDMTCVDDVLMQRIVDIALPFLNLIPVAAIVSHVALGSIKTWKHFSLLPEKKGDISAFTWEWLQGCIAITSIALALFAPPISVLFSSAIKLIQDLYTLFIDLHDQQWSKVLWTLLSMLQTCVYAASIFYALPEVILLSLLIQIIVELSEAISEFLQGRYPEAAAKCLLALIRIGTAVPHTIELHRNYFGKKVTKEEFVDVVSEARTEKKPVQEIFKKHHYSNRVENLDLSKQVWISLEIDHLIFDGCEMSDLRSIRCTYRHVTIVRSNARNAAFFNNIFDDVSIDASKLRYACFNESFLYRLRIKDSDVKQTSFLHATVKDSSLILCDLTDILLAGNEHAFKRIDCTEVHLTKPVIAIAWNFETPQRMAKTTNEVLKENGAIPLRYDFNPSYIDPSLINNEVKTLLADLKEPTWSIPQTLLARAQSGSQIRKLQENAAIIAKYAHGILIPGGLDIEPELYGREKEVSTVTRGDYRNSILDFALIQEAIRQRIPTMCTCKGGQALNVYFGGTLKQHVDGHLDVFHPLTIDPKAPLWMQQEIRKIAGDSLYGYSHHHQAVDTIGRGLHSVLLGSGEVEAMMSEDDLFLSVQFHPEFYYLYERNKSEYPFLKGHIEDSRRFFKRFISKSKLT